MTITAKDNMKDVAKVYKKIKSLSTKMTADLEQQGQSFTMEMITKQKSPNLFKLEIKAMGMTMQKEVFNGEGGGTMDMQNGKKDFTAEEIADRKLSHLLDKDLRLKDLGYQLNLISIEEVNGNDAYKIELVDSKGKSSFEYYDVDSKLKVYEIKTEEDDNGEIITSTSTFSDYKLVKGVLYAHSIAMSFGSMEFEMIVKSIQINPKYDSGEFEW